MESKDHTSGHHPHHGIFISLVIAIILLVGIFFLFIYSVFLVPEVEVPIVSDLEQRIEESILEDIEEVTIAEEEVEETSYESIILDAIEPFPSLEYPIGWHISYQTFETHEPYLWISPKPIFNLDASDAPPAPIILELLPENPAIYASYETIPGQENYIENFEEVNENGVITFTGMLNENSIRPGEYFEEIIFPLNDKQFSLRISFRSTETELIDGWNIIKNSLNFSNIE